MNEKAAQQIEEMTLNGIDALLDVAQDQADSERNQQEQELQQKVVFEDWYEVHVKIITPLNVPDGLIGSEMVDFPTLEEAEAYKAGLDNMLKMCEGISAISDILYDGSGINYLADIKRVAYPKM